MTEQFITALIVAFVSTGGAFLGSWLSSRSTLRGSENALIGINRQMKLRNAEKLADFRQNWINELRKTLSEYQAAGIAYEETKDMKVVLQLDAHIRLMVNKNDPRYHHLVTLMGDLLMAPDRKSRYEVATKFVTTGQDILKTEWEVLKADLAAAAA